MKKIITTSLIAVAALGLAACTPPAATNTTEATNEVDAMDSNAMEANAMDANAMEAPAMDANATEANAMDAMAADGNMTAK